MGNISSKTKEKKKTKTEENGKMKTKNAAGLVDLSAS